MYSSNPETSSTVKIVGMLVFSLLLLFSSHIAATDITADITTDTTWNLAGSPYALIYNITVSEGVTLTLDPDVVVRSNLHRGLFVLGTLAVNGNSSNPVTFTGSTEQPDWWRGIQISGAGSGNLNHARINYGGYIENVNLSKSGSGSLTLNSVTLSHSDAHGLLIDSNTGALDANSCTFSDNGNSGVKLGLNMSSDFIDDSSVFSGNPKAILIAGGTMTSNATWDLNSSYSMYLEDNLTVADGATLTVAPGTVVKSNLHDRISVQGELLAQGTAGSPIHFTDPRDDTVGGDANADGDATLPGANWWQGIQISGSGTATLDHTRISYGGYIENVNLSKSGSGNLTLNNVTISHSNTHGLLIDSNTGALDANSCTFTDNGYSGVWLGLNMSSDFIDDSSVFNGNPRAIGIAGGTMTSNATWDLNSSYSMYLDDNLTVADSATLTVAPGTVIKSNLHDRIFVQGELLAQGTAGSPIHFTDPRDDTVGGDANADGDATLPGANWWRGIQISGSGTATLDHTRISYGGYIENVNLSKSGSGSLTLNNVTISHSNAHGLLIDSNTGALDANSCTFSDNGYSGVWLGLNMSSDFIDDNSVFSGNPRAIGIACGTMAGDATWDLNSSYSMYLDDNLTVADSATLTVAPGTVVKSNLHDRISVQGELLAQGTAGSPIHFTDPRDDTVGGDANADGDATLPGANWWRGIQISGSGTATLDHTRISYGGYIENVNLSKSGTGSLTLNNVTISHSNTHGLLIDSNTGALDANSCTFTDNGYSGVWLALNMSSDFIDAASKFDNNARDIGIAGGTMDASVTWKLNSAYSMYLDDNLTVAATGRLNIAPGTVIKSNLHDRLFVQGELLAQGTTGSPIYFTDPRDDTVGGDANRDGDATLPGADWWRGIQISGAGSATLKHAHIRYGGYIEGVNLSKTGSGSLSLINSTLSNSSNTGLYINNSTGNHTLKGNLFSDNQYGIKLVAPPAGTAIIASRMESNSLFGILNNGPNEVDARINWWGDPSGPFHATKNAAGLGNPVSDLVLFDPWRTTSATSTIKAPIHSGAILEGDSLRFIGAASDDPSHTYLWDLAEGRSSNLLVPGIVSFHTQGSRGVSFALVDNAGSNDPNPDSRQLSVEADTAAYRICRLPVCRHRRICPLASLPAFPIQ